MSITTRIEGFARYVPVLLAVLGMACSKSDESTPAPADGQASQAARPAATEMPIRAPLTPDQFDLTHRALAAAEAEISRDTFEPRAIVERVGNDPGSLTQWVRQNTSWVPYRGALRGPVGVLMDRRGNSLDRSLLLAEMLRTAGHSVRLARGTISAQDAQSLVMEMSATPLVVVGRKARAFSGIEELDIQENATRFHIDADWLSQAIVNARAEYTAATDEISGRIKAQVPFLTEAVGPPKAAAQDTAKAVSTLGDHWWVQRSDGTQWVDLDVTLTDVQRKSARLMSIESHPFDRPTGEIPLTTQHAHEIVLRVIVEQWKNGRLTENVALEHSFKPSEVFGQSILLQNIPLHWKLDAGFLSEADPLESFKDRMLEQSEWLPHLTIGNRGFHQSSVLENGDLNSKPDVTPDGSDPGGVADTLGGFDSFGGGEDELAEAESHFTAEWIEYETRVPGENPRVVRRTVFDFLPGRSGSALPVGDPAPNLKRRLARTLGLTGSIQILPLVSRLSQEYALSRVTLENLRNQKFLFGLKQTVGEDNPGAAFDEIRKCPPTTRRLYELALARFEWSEVDSDVYLESPNILTFRRGAGLDARGQLVGIEGYDIVSNSVAVDLRSGKRPFDVRLSQGVADTNAESLLMGDGSSGAGSLMGTDVRAASWATLRKADNSVSADTSMPMHIRQVIDEAVKAGYVVVAPRTSGRPEGSGRWDWWRIDPKSGETLGFNQNGWGGSDTAEVGILQVTLGVGLGASAGVYSGMLAYVGCLSVVNTIAGRPANGVAYQARQKGCMCVAVDVGTGVGLGVAAGIIGGFGFGVAVFISAEAMGKVVCGALALASAEAAPFQAPEPRGRNPSPAEPPRGPPRYPAQPPPTPAPPP